MIFAASGYASQVVGGSAPANSGITAYVTMGCINRTGVERQNRVVASRVGQTPVRVAAGETTLRSLRVPGGFASDSVQTVDTVRVGLSDSAFLRVNDVRVASRAAIIDDAGRATSSTTLGSAQLVVAGRTQNISLRQLRNGVTVPGVAAVELGGNRTISRPHSASARGFGLRITRLGGTGTPTVITIGRALAHIDRVPKFGVFGGKANIGTTRTRSGVVTSGPLVHKPMPCTGTDGQWVRNSAADAELSNAQLEQGRVGVNAQTLRRFAAARSNARVDQAVLLGGRLLVEGLNASSFARRNADGTRQANSNGTSVDRVTFDAQRLRLPPGRPVEIPGVARITFRSERRTRTGIAVTGLRVELLSGRSVVVELANASSYIR